MLTKQGDLNLVIGLYFKYSAGTTNVYVLPGCRSQRGELSRVKPDEGKPGESQGRKASELRQCLTHCHASGVAGAGPIWPASVLAVPFIC